MQKENLKVFFLNFMILESYKEQESIPMVCEKETGRRFIKMVKLKAKESIGKETRLEFGRRFTKTFINQFFNES